MHLLQVNRIGLVSKCVEGTKRVIGNGFGFPDVRVWCEVQEEVISLDVKRKQNENNFGSFLVNPEGERGRKINLPQEK